MKKLLSIPTTSGCMFDHGNMRVKIEHRRGDPEDVYRIVVNAGSTQVEVLPTKGFSIGEAYYNQFPFFWVPPRDHLLSPKKYDINAPFSIRGVERRGLRWVEAFTGGVEMLGLSNWGMAKEEDNVLFGLHGEASNLPIKHCDICFDGDSVSVTGELVIHGWDEDGYPAQTREELYLLTKTVTVRASNGSIELRDSIKNISTIARTPDWGYHIQLRPEPLAKLITESKVKENRTKGPLSSTHDIWQPVTSGSPRVEVGTIHKKLRVHRKGEHEYVKALLHYPDNRGILVHLPPSPYYQTWLSSGGAGSEEFCYPAEKKGDKPTPLLNRNWDGIGPEIGASSLDNGGRVDPDVKTPILLPGESQVLDLKFEMLMDASCEVNKMAAY